VPASPGRRFRALVAPLLIFGLTSACGADPAPPSSFALVGDSLAVRISCPMELSQACLRSRVITPDGPLANAMAGAYDVAVDAEGGTRIRQMLDRAQALVDLEPDVIAENLGTNDSIRGNIGWAEPFERLVERPCVILTTVSIATEERDPGANHIASHINSAIAGAAHDHRQVRVVDWAAAVLDRGAELSEDGFHPTTAAGRVWLAEAYREAADSCSA